RSNRVDRCLAHALGTQWAENIRGLGEIDLAAWDVGISRDPVVPERRVDDPSLLVEDHFFVKGPSQSLGNPAFDLPPYLYRIDHHPGIDSLNALEDLDCSGHAMDCDTKTMHVEGHRARRAIALAHDLQEQPRLSCRVVKLNQPDPRTITGDGIHFKPALVTT